MNLSEAKSEYLRAGYDELGKSRISAELSEARIARAIRFALSRKMLTMAEFVNQWHFHRGDMIALNTARKIRSRISSPPKSKCNERCKAAHLR